MSEKFLVLFLGNSGNEYTETRHNAGWIIADELVRPDQWQENKYAEALSVIAPGDFTVEKVQSEDPTVPGLYTERADVFYAKPLTFMNLSGKTARYYCEKERIKRDQVIVVYDDIDIPVGQFKLSQGRGDGNHNGIKSLIKELGTKSFIRIRIGVGSPDRGPGVGSFVLARFRPEEVTTIRALASRVSQCLHEVVLRGAIKAMNSWN